jgi:hypothetical protein
MKMQLACSCCSQIRAVTIKGIDKTDGTTVWEYGPGSYWRHHYGADAISGVVPNLSATLNKYAIAAGAFPAYNACGNRNSGTLAPNSAEALTITKLDSTDGTVVESATMAGFFCDVIGTSFVGLMTGLTIDNAAALSGGDYVIVGERLPFIEFVDYNTNTVNKEYVLHAHGQQNGNVYLKTRTSNETITIPYNAAASAVETLFEATSDCVAATATGGPWPLLPISIDVEWSVAGGDIASISATDTYTATGTLPVNTFTTNYSIFPFTTAQLILGVSVVSIDSIWSFTFDGGGATFDYTSTTDDPATFITALEAAMESFKTSQGTDGFWDSAVITETGGDLHVTYAYGIRHLQVTVDDGVDPVEDSRRAGSCAAAYDTGTGAMTSAVGYEFGYSADRPTLRMFEDADDNPTVSGLNVLGIRSIGAGPSNAVVITPQLRGSGDGVKASVVEKWSISGGVWSFGWQTFCNATLSARDVIDVESGLACIPIRPARFDGVRDRTAATVAFSDTTVVEVMTTYGSLSTGSVATTFIDGSSTSFLSWGYDIRYTGYNPNNTFRINADGSDTWVDESFLKIGATAFGSDGSSVYGLSHPATERFGYDPWPEMLASHIIGYHPIANQRSDEPQQFRFRFTRMPGINYTAWLDWNATTAEMTTALEALLGSGNVEVDHLPSYHATLENSPDVVIEKAHMWVRYLMDVGFSPGSGRIPGSWLSTRAGEDIIEVQTVTKFTDPAGIAAYSVTDASLLWSRAWGTKDSQTISQPLYAWLRGDFVYAYGNVVDNEL